MTFTKGHPFYGSKDRLFKKGHQSWLTGTKGLIHPKNVFKKGHIPWNKDKPKVEIECKQCKKMFEVILSRKDTAKYCSVSCRSRSMLNSKGFWFGKERDNNFKRNQSISQRKRFDTEIPWNKGIITDKKRGKRKNDMEWRKHCDWRKAIFERDNFTCVLCHKKGVRLEADHIKMWMLFPELRYSLDNGQTLCISCHRKKTSNELSKYWKNQYIKNYLYKEMI